MSAQSKSWRPKNVAELFAGPAPHLMGILNVTPDSFSDGGLYLNSEAALNRATELISQGAKIIDLGGESTRPGSQPISAQVELERILPVLKQLTAAKITVSVDTYKGEVARAVLEAGALMINDISAGRASPEIFDLVAEHQACIVLMYSKETAAAPHATLAEKQYSDLIAEVAVFLSERVQAAVAAGVAPERIILDPGLGRFLSHSPQDSLELIDRLAQLKAALKAGVGEFPLLVGISRKGFVPGANLEEKDQHSTELALRALSNGAQIVRTHRPELIAVRA